MRKVLIVLMALMVAGCAKPAGDATYPSGKVPSGIYDIQLSDGTRCVVVYDRAISCDWEKSPE